MEVEDILTVQRISCGAHAGSKKKALEVLSQLLARGNDDLTSQDIFESLLNREKLGTTSLGFGVALPHGRQSKTDVTSGAFLLLDEAIDYDAVDDQKVDLLFALLVPQDSTDQHLQLLATLAEMFSNSAFRDELRKSTSPEEAYSLLSSGEERS